MYQKFLRVLCLLLCAVMVLGALPADVFAEAPDSCGNGLTWSLELYQQTNARLWRQGQQADTVVIHHIITQGTIDEAIMKALSEKDKSQAALIDAVKAQLEVRK